MPNNVECNLAKYHLVRASWRGGAAAADHLLPTKIAHVEMCESSVIHVIPATV